MMNQGIGCVKFVNKNKNEAKRPVKTNLASADKSNVCEYDAKMPRSWNKSKLKEQLKSGS